MMHIETKITTYLDERTSNLQPQEITIRNIINYGKLVEMEISGTKVIVNKDELIKAVENATNVL